MNSATETLRTVAAEVSHLADMSDRLQALISSALLADTTTNAGHLKEFQAIDLLVQRLHGVAIFISALAETTHPDWRVDAAAAAANIPLSDLARRLSGAAPTERAREDEPLSDGDLELFG